MCQAPGLQAGLLVDTGDSDLLGFEFLSSVVSTVPGGSAVCILDGSGVCMGGGVLGAGRFEMAVPG